MPASERVERCSPRARGMRVDRERLDAAGIRRCSPRARGMRGAGRITARSVGCLSTRARDAGGALVCTG